MWRRCGGLLCYNFACAIALPEARQVASSNIIINDYAEGFRGRCDREYRGKQLRLTMQWLCANALRQARARCFFEIPLLSHFPSLFHWNLCFSCTCLKKCPITFFRFSPTSVSTLWGSYGNLGVVYIEVFLCVRGFRLRRLGRSSVCDDGIARIGTLGILGCLFTGCPCTFWSKTWFYVTDAGDRMSKRAVTVSRLLPQAPPRRFKNLTAAAASRMLPRFRYKNFSTSLLVGVHSHTVWGLLPD